MTITASVVADSITNAGQRLISWELNYPHFVHPQLLTHRAFSRGASSGRAVSVRRNLSMTASDIARPIQWGANIVGMQSDTNLPPEIAEQCRAVWDDMALYCREGAAKLAELGLHKQWANRPTEWFSDIRVLCSATETDNFFALRDHPNAQPEIQALARAMREAKRVSTPRTLGPMQWHLPYIERQDYVMFDTHEGAEWDGTGAHPISTLIKLSVARCARVSYRNAQGHLPATDHDLSLYARLMSETPIHASPAEHQATPVVDECSAQLAAKSNFTGWVQYRKIVERR